MKATIYCTVATEAKGEEGKALQSQLEACLRKAHELGCEVPEEFSLLETGSGVNLDRPKLN